MRALLVGMVLTFSAGHLTAENDWSEAGSITYLGVDAELQRVTFKIQEQNHLGGTTCPGRFYSLEFEDNPLAEEMYSFLLSHKATREKVMVYWKTACDNFGNPIVSFLQTPE